ncbi:MAG: universal stress protein [Desulfobacterales bacterium]|jgi:nucleotide-binding universal stress UspA family protein|nr:universal stress protein [Desulfobacterales bacterium]
MFNKILFATSAAPACDHAARVAFDMAGRYNAQIVIFHVLGVPTRGYSQIVKDVATGDEVVLDDNYLELVVDEIKNYYEIQLKNIKTHKIEVAIGFPHREILRLARQIAPDIIIMGGSTGSADSSVYKKGFIGSTFQKVAKAVHCPLLVVNRPAASFWGGISNIVFGTDFTPAADGAFDFAFKIAKELACEFHIFHALDVTGSGVNQFAAQEMIEDRIRKARHQIRSRYLSRMGGFNNYSAEVWEGIPFIEIVKYARENHADMIVMAHHTPKPDSPDSELGSVVEQVILRANCPVVSINRLAVK